jgi:hypothetical protein
MHLDEGQVLIAQPAQMHSLPARQITCAFKIKVPI